MMLRTATCRATLKLPLPSSSTIMYSYQHRTLSFGILANQSPHCCFHIGSYRCCLPCACVQRRNQSTYSPVDPNTNPNRNPTSPAASSQLTYPNFSFDIIYHNRNHNHKQQQQQRTSPTSSSASCISQQDSSGRSRESSKARVGKIVTPHGTIDTPNFIFCGTKACVKCISPEQLKREGTGVILSNTYHLMLSPGAELVEKMGKLHKFMSWDGPMLTDSGGYQVFSMGFGSVSEEIKGNRQKKANVDRIGSNNSNSSSSSSSSNNSSSSSSSNDSNSSSRSNNSSNNCTSNISSNNKNKNSEIRPEQNSLIKVDENGAKFRSYVDGTVIDLTPERSIDVQRKLGADLILVFDECTPFNVPKEYTEASMNRSHRWAVRCIDEFRQKHDGSQALYGIIQGGVYEDLRRQSVEFNNSQPFFGIAIGGSLGRTKRDMHAVVKLTCDHLRRDVPVHLLGIGGLVDIFHGVRQGIDTFDCVHPTRIARHGLALVKAAFWSERRLTSADIDPETLPLVEKNAQQVMDNKKRAKERAKGGSIVAMHNSINSDISSDISSDINSGGGSRIEATSFVKSRLKRDNQPLMIREHVKLETSSFRYDDRPIDSSCQCYTCKTFSRSYLHHLIKADELLYLSLLTIHNVHFMNRMMLDIRSGIKEDRLDEVEDEYIHPSLKVRLE